MGVIRFLLIGAASGWRAGQVMKRRGFGVLGNMIGGVVCALVGGFIFGFRGGGPAARLGPDALKRSVDWERLHNRAWPSGGIRPIGVPVSRLTAMSFTRATTIGLLILMTMLLNPRPLSAAAVPVRFVEGATHGFLVLRTVDGVLIASGDLLQVGRGGGVESRMVFHFKDGSLFDETVVFTQQHVFTMQSYHLVQRGPVFPEDTEISLERTGKYRVKTKDHKDGREEVLDGTLELPPDVYNGMVLTVAKNLPKGASETVHLVAFTRTPRLIQLEMVPAGEHKVLVGELAKTAIHYVLKPQLGTWLKLFVTVLGRMPPDYHAWIITDEVPAFARFEGPLYMTGPIWRIELTSPRWSD
jgi:uncharacterized membrane protein YeaQ/YmgE (transglycosylase-associated protein family)